MISILLLAFVLLIYFFIIILLLNTFLIWFDLILNPIVIYFLKILKSNQKYFVWNRNLQILHPQCITYRKLFFCLKHLINLKSYWDHKRGIWIIITILLLSSLTCKRSLTVARQILLKKNLKLSNNWFRPYITNPPTSDSINGFNSSNYE